MKSASLPANEVDRLKALEETKLLDTLPEDVYDDITRIASEITGTPMALLNLIDKDRLWTKSHQGIDVQESPRDTSFCAHAILDPNEIMVVEDARFDERFYDNPSTIGEPYVVFYAGIPVLSADNYPIGTLCIIDNRPRILSDSKIIALKALAKQINIHFELRKCRQELEQIHETLRDAEDSNSQNNSAGEPSETTLSLISQMESSLQKLQASNPRADQVTQLASLQEFTRSLKTSLSV